MKYYTTPLRLKEMHKEEEQIRAIKGIQVGRIGFIATAGYEETPDSYDCILAEDLYHI